MRIRFQMAILLALAALPAGVALMAAPEYISILKEYPGPFFWGGLILASGLILAAIVIAVHGEASEPKAGHRRRMIALTGMVVCGLGFILFSGIYFWPQRSTNPLQSAEVATETAKPKVTAKRERAFVSPEVTPERLFSFYRDNTAIQANEITKQY